MKTYYKNFLIKPSETIYSPKLQIINKSDCDDFVRYAETLQEAKEIIDEKRKNNSYS